MNIQTEHKKLLAVKKRLNNLLEEAINIDEEEIQRIQEQCALTEGLYDYYRILIDELSDCIQQYNANRNKTRIKMYKSIKALKKYQ